MNKNEIRKVISKRRKSMSENEVKEKSKIIIEKLMNTDEFKKAKNLMVFLSFDNEVYTFDLIEKAMNMGKKVIVPYTVKDTCEIIPTLLKSIEEDLEVSNYGYMEPKKDKIQPILEENIDMTVVPGLAFDEKMNRIGFGKGYYDRYLTKTKKESKNIAIAYDYQVLEEIPSEDFDVKMDYIITEEKIYKNAE
ncbi:MAG: 5-formyltetrahydrofolate cyclo-ligase [Bacillota bacterium]|nr:5-formyltetrahydrofolate cyclo-ligase [Bacillota bacterium]